MRGLPLQLHNPGRVWAAASWLATVTLLALGSSAIASESATVRTEFRCNRVASPAGSDRANGTLRSPYRTFDRLAESLQPGMVGCLRGGVYGDRMTDHNIERGGRSGRRITITGYPRERATIAGAVFISNGADYVTLSHVTVNGANNVHADGKPQAMEIWGRHFVLQDSNLTNHKAATSGILIFGDAPVIRRNKIHSIGANFGYDHGIYVANSHNFKIEYNWIYDCRAGWGVQLFPHAVRGTVAHNIIDGCGSGITISGGDELSSRDNRIEHNLITNSVGLGRFNPGTAVAGCCDRSPNGNVVIGNVFWRNRGGAFDGYRGQSYVEFRNISSNPRYVNRAEKDFGVRARRARALGLWNGVPAKQPVPRRTRGG
jgi:Right handed beta helix region